MKKILLTILIILLCILTYVTVWKSLKIGVLKIESFSDLNNINYQLDSDLKKATKLTAQTYPETKNTLNSAINKFKTVKQQYEDKIANIPNSDVLSYMQVDTYEKEFLWATIGTYATKENLDLELNIIDKENNDFYNLEFEIVGRYSDISDFIYLVENDDELGFRIQNFSIQPYMITEKTTITEYQGARQNKTEEYDNAYDVSTKKEYDNHGTKEDNSSNVRNPLSTTDNITTNNSNNTKQTNTSSTIMYSPDRVQAKFVVTNVNINMK